jgi:hypothetical protein
MWPRFRKKNRQDSKGPAALPAEPADRVQELANALQRDGRVKELEGELEKLDRASLSREEQQSWWHLYGITAFQAGRDAEAMSRFQEAYARFPGSAPIRFSLGQQYVRAKAVDQGFELFRTCRFPEVPREYALMQARYAYLWGRYEDGLTFLRPFFKFYQQIKILDDHFLYVRGLPFFGTWWGYLAALTILSGKLEELESTTRSVVKHCHDYDFDALQAKLQAYRDDQPARLLTATQKRLDESVQRGWSADYTRLNLAVIKALAAKTFAEANALLTAPHLGEADSAWLEDIRTLALAEAAHRFGDPRREGESIKVFLERQPLLLEPDNALEFHMLRYQENLKPLVAAP